MAWAGTLTYGSTTVNIWNSTSGIQMTETYLPNAGADFSEFGTVTEDIEFIITGSTKADIEVHMRELNRAFMNARLRQERNAGDRAYFNLTPDGYSAAWRSEILDAIIQPGMITGPWGRMTLKVVGSWTRRNWWDGPEAAVPLTNSNDTDDTSGIKVYSTNDGSGAAGSIHENYVAIDGVNDVSGDLPGYGILGIVTAQKSAKIFVSGGPSADATVWFHETGTGTADAADSAGYYQDTAISSGVATIALNPAALYSGAPCRMIARLAHSSAGTYRVVPFCATRLAAVENFSSVYITSAAGHAAALGIHPLGVMTPGVYNTTGSAPVAFYSYLGFSLYAASGTLSTDFIQLAPCSWIRDYIITTGVLAQTIRDDTTADNLSCYDSASPPAKNYRAVSAQGSNKILLYPGVDQKIFFMLDPWEIDFYVTVTLSYRPRRSTL